MTTEQKGKLIDYLDKTLQYTDFNLLLFYGEKIRLHCLIPKGRNEVLPILMKEIDKEITELSAGS